MSSSSTLRTSFSSALVHEVSPGRTGSDFTLTGLASRTGCSESTGSTACKDGAFFAAERAELSADVALAVVIDMPLWDRSDAETRRQSSVLQRCRAEFLLNSRTAPDTRRARQWRAPMRLSCGCLN